MNGGVVRFLPTAGSNPVPVTSVEPLPVTLAGGQLVPEVYDELVLSYTGDDLTTVEYLLDGDVIATLSLTYDGGKLVRVERV